MIRILPVLLGLAAAGCTAGKNFEPPSFESVVLNQTTRQEILDRFGTPYKEGSAIQNGATLKKYTYAFASSHGSGHNGSSTIPARGMVFTFHEDRVVSYVFMSSFEADHTEFDETKVPEIRKGETTRDGVIALLGPPKGKCVFPMIDGKQDEGTSYVYHQTKRKFMGGIHIYMQELTVSFGPDGRVSDVKFTSSGEK
jgi:hypothetical protein